MVLADPGRVHGQVFGKKGFRHDIRYELVRGPWIVGVTVIAQGKITEVHEVLPFEAWRSRAHSRKSCRNRSAIGESFRSFGQLTPRWRAAPVSVRRIACNTPDSRSIATS